MQEDEENGCRRTKYREQCSCDRMQPEREARRDHGRCPAQQTEFHKTGADLRGSYQSTGRHGGGGRRAERFQETRQMRRHGR
jgi:hypothetical protein